MQNVLSPVAPQAEIPAGKTGPLLPGQKFAGCYQLRRQVGNSSSAAVWLAFDEVLGREVSLHFIPNEVRGDLQAIGKLRQEIKRNRQLIHPNILRIYDLIGEADWAAISMDTLTGESLAGLREKKASGFFEVAEIKPWLLQICKTLDDAHKISLFHCALSVENLFLEKDGRLLIGNFGTSRCIWDACWRAQPESPGAQRVENLSPQLLDGQAPSTADDIYGVGVLLHELLAGQPPFVGSDVIEKTQKSAPSSMLERRAQREKAGGPIPPNWERIAESCLQKQPEQRPGNLNEIVTRLGLDKPNGGASLHAAELATTPVQNEMPLGNGFKSAGTADTVTRRKAVRTVSMSAAPGTEQAASLRVSTNREFATKPKDAMAVPASAGIEAPVEDCAPLKQASAEKSTNASLLASAAASAGKSISDNYPTLNPKRGVLKKSLVAAAVLAALCLYPVFSGRFNNSREANATELMISDNAPIESFGPTLEASPLSEKDAEARSAAYAVGTPRNSPNGPEVSELAPALTVAVRASQQRERAANPMPMSPAVESLKPGEQRRASGVAAQATAMGAAKKAAEEAEKSHQDMLIKKQQAEAAVSEAKKTLVERTAAAAPMLKAAEEIITLKAKREEEVLVATLAADEAKRLAEEKSRVVTQAKKAVVNIDRDSKEKFAARQRIEAELKRLQDTVTEKERLAAEAGSNLEAALAKRDQQRLAAHKAEEQLTQAKAVAEEAEKTALARKEEEEKRAAIKKEMEEAKRQYDQRMKALEAALKTPEAAPVSPPAKAPAETAPAAPKSEPVGKLKREAPPPAPSNPQATDARKPVNTNLIGATPGSSLDAGPTEMTNSLGMKFAPVGDLLFSIWPTRVSDFEAFASSTGLKSTLWREPDFRQEPNHPVVNVTWMEAVAFCKWLTFKEQRERLLAADKIYRLPTDLEWSKAVGLPEETGKTPELRDMAVRDVYPWGTQWPPPPGAGNYTGEETGLEVAIPGYNDGFSWTLPVGRFQPNKYGLYDMGGNVWQWVSDAWNSTSKSKVLRGASWYNGAVKLCLLSSCRVHAAQDSCTDNYGFRCVVGTEIAISSTR